MSGKMQDKIVVITGSGSGIGREAALIFAREGAKVVVSDVNVAGGDETVSLVKDAGGEATFIQCDVSKGPEVEGLIKGAVDTYGRLDAAFNNAGVEGDTQATTITCTEENFDLNIAVNLKGVWWCMKYEIEQFLRQGFGRHFECVTFQPNVIAVVPHANSCCAGRVGKVREIVRVSGSV